MTDRTFLKNYFDGSQETVKRLTTDDAVVELVSAIAVDCVASINAGGKLLFAGNGGSAADSQHMAGEYVSRFMIERPGLPAIALTTDTSILTAIGNDYGYEELFARQIQALGSSEDVLFVYSTSGNSTNCLKGIAMARSKNIKIVGMTGMKGGAMDSECDHLVRVPSDSTPHIQEGHLIIGHAICAMVEHIIFGNEDD